MPHVGWEWEKSITKEQALAAWLEIGRAGPAALAKHFRIAQERGVWLYEAYNLESYYGPSPPLDPESGQDLPLPPFSEAVLNFFDRPLCEICYDLDQFIMREKLDRFVRHRPYDLPLRFGGRKI